MNTNLDCALTSISCPQVMPSAFLTPEAQLEVIAGNLPAAARTLVYSNQKLGVAGFGFMPILASDNVPKFREAVLKYVMSIRGRELVGIYDPTTKVSADFASMFSMVNMNPMEFVWGAYAKIKSTDEVPRLFVVTNSILGHVLNDIPRDLDFYGTAWATWLHTKLKAFTQPHRYIDITELGIVSSAIQQVIPTPIDEPAPIVVPESIREPKKRVVKKKKK